MNQVLKNHAKHICVSVIMGLSSASPALADYYCTVNVNAVLPYSNGLVNVLHTGRSDFTMICSLTNTYTNGGNTVQPETCTIWTAILLQAKKNNTQVTFWFPGTGTCATLATYSNSPVPTYIGP